MKPSSLVFAALLIAIALIGGATYEQSERARDRDRLPQIGRSVDIGGRSLNIECSGSGHPTVIFEAGAPRSGYSWVFIQREVAKFTRACWYDRAGFGWSDLGPYPRTSAASTHDLHALLDRAGIAPPYILVAETLAAFEARLYTSFYPAEAAGIVLVDGDHPDLLKRIPQIRGKAAPIQKYIGYPQSVASRVFRDIGVLRLLPMNRRPSGPPPPGLTPEEWATIGRLTNQPRARVALMQELPVVDESSAQVRASGDLGDRPLRVISATPTYLDGKALQISMELQADLARLSTRGKQIGVQPQAPGLLLYQAPHAVIGVIREVLDELRAGEPAH